MKLLNHGGSRALTSHFLSPMKFPVPGMDYIELSCWPKGSHGNPHPQAVAKIIGCSPQTDDKALLLNTTPIQLTEHREVQLVPA